ncbi:MAG TPA: hypothetical protein VHE61_24255 [Opitutaceae bacterium]|nr:hypothetical protein [Opitutaceae bacterium]
MAAESTSSTLPRRSNLDLIASDEALTAILLGLEHLLHRLEAARAEREKAAFAGAESSLTPDASRAVAALPHFADPADDRQWYYEPEAASRVILAS